MYKSYTKDAKITKRKHKVMFMQWWLQDFLLGRANVRPTIIGRATKKEITTKNE